MITCHRKFTRFGFRKVLLSSIIQLVAFLTAFSPSLATSEENPECLSTPWPAPNIHSREELGDAISERLKEQFHQFGRIDWACIENDFVLNFPEGTVDVYLNVGREEKDVYRFNVPKSLIDRLLSFAPGSSRYYHTAIFNHFGTSAVALVQRGGKLKWVKLESKQM